MTKTDTAITRWFGESVNFGGEQMSRADVYRWFEAQGYPSRCADLWLIGYENTHGTEAISNA